MFVELWTGYIGRSITFIIECAKKLSVFEDVVQCLLNICLYDVCPSILTEPRSNQI